MCKLLINSKQIILFKDINLNKKEVLTIDWSRKNNKNFSCMHSISSYIAMFPPSLPHYFICKYTQKNDIVMDNFSGRGTTGLVCRQFNRGFIGSDLNPYSAVLTRMKIEKYQKNDLIDFVNNLASDFEQNKHKYLKKVNLTNYEELRIFYSNHNLTQLIFLQEKIGKSWMKNNSIENAVLGYACGLMHGQMKKDKSTSYFSLHMPNTISMSPNYVLNYSMKKNLIKPKTNIFDQIIKRIEKKFDPLINHDYNGQFYLFDATKINDKIQNESIDLIITSPPYLNIVDYTLSNWLKLWLLGYDRKKIKQKIKLSDNLKYHQYLKFIKDYLIAIYPKLKSNAKVCLIIGDFYGKKIIEKIWQTICDEINYEFVELYYDQKYDQNHKITNMLSAKNVCTKIEQIIVLTKK